MNTNDLINNWISQSDCFVDYLETLKYEELDNLLFSYKDYDIAIAEALKKYGNKLGSFPKALSYMSSNNLGCCVAIDFSISTPAPSNDIVPSQGIVFFAKTLPASAFTKVTK